MRADIAFLNDMDVDSLTGVGTRQWFEHAMANACRAANFTVTPISLLCIDIDLFGQYVALHDRATADCELVRIARALHRLARAEDAFARIDGDEFALLLPNTDASYAAETAERCRIAAQVMPNFPTSLAATVSVGFATAWRAPEPEKLLGAARHALAEAKAGGRNIVAMYRPSQSF